MDDKAIIDLMPTARRMAHGFWRRRAKHVDKDDLVGAAYLALVKAARDHEVALGSYEHFAPSRIKYALLDAHRKADMLPRSLRRCAGHTQSVVVNLDHQPVSQEVSPEVSAMIAEHIERRMKIVEMLSRGMSNRTIAETIGRSEQSIKNALKSVYRAIGVNNRTEMALWYINHHPEYLAEQAARIAKAKASRRKKARIRRLEAELAELRGEQ